MNGITYSKRICYSKKNILLVSRIGKNISIIPLYVPTPTERHEKVVRLFFFKSGKNSHYCVINSMSRLVSKQVSKHRGKNVRVRLLFELFLDVRIY